MGYQTGGGYYGMSVGDGLNIMGYEAEVLGGVLIMGWPREGEVMSYYGMLAVRTRVKKLAKSGYYGISKGGGSRFSL